LVDEKGYKGTGFASPIKQMRQDMYRLEATQPNSMTVQSQVRGYSPRSYTGPQGVDASRGFQEFGRREDQFQSGGYSNIPNIVGMDTSRSYQEPERMREDQYQTINLPYSQGSDTSRSFQDSERRREEPIQTMDYSNIPRGEETFRAREDTGAIADQMGRDEGIRKSYDYDNLNRGKDKVETQLRDILRNIVDVIGDKEAKQGQTQSQRLTTATGGLLARPFDTTGMVERPLSQSLPNQELRDRPYDLTGGRDVYREGLISGREGRLDTLPREGESFGDPRDVIAHNPEFNTMPQEPEP